MHRRIKIVLQLERVFDPCFMVFRRVWGGGKKQLNRNVSAKKRKTFKYCNVFWRERFIIRGALEPNPHEKRGASVLRTRGYYS